MLQIELLIKDRMQFDATDPNLVNVINAWPTRPEPIRRAMLALIR